MRGFSGNPVCRLFAFCLIGLCGCGSPEPPAKPAGLSMAKLKAENRSPLEIVQFTVSPGVGDAIAGSVLNAADEPKKGSGGKTQEKESEVIVRRHLLTVTNVSNCYITAFRAKVRFEDDKGQSVICEKATTETNYVADVGDGIAPGMDEQLVLQLMVPKDAKAKFQLNEILYKDRGTVGVWRATGEQGKPDAPKSGEAVPEKKPAN